MRDQYDDDRMSKNATITLHGRTIEKVEVRRYSGTLKLKFTDGTGCVLDASGTPPTIFVRPLSR